MEDIATVGELSPAFAQALVDVQGNIEGAKKGSTNPAFRSKYADLAACWDACGEALQAAKIAVLQFPCKADPGHVGLLTTLVYGPTGETIGCSYQLPLKDPTNAQAGGSAITYLRRYSLCSVLGIRTQDDDGNAASAKPHRGVNDSKDSGSRNPPVREEAKGPPGQDGTGYQARFNSCTSNDERKSLYSEVKNSTLAEPFKTQLLAQMATEIKKSK